MEKLIRLINDSELHPVELAARAHHKFVAIHPFDDGNGRVARVLMNLLLMKSGYLPVVVKNELREEYYRALMKADDGEISDFINLITREEENSLQMVVNVAKECSSDQ
jgi:Fic family protein